MPWRRPRLTDIAESLCIAPLRAAPGRVCCPRGSSVDSFPRLPAKRNSWTDRPTGPPVIWAVRRLKLSTPLRKPDRLERRDGKTGPAGEEREPAERRHRTQHRHTGEGQRVEAAGEQEDASGEAPAGGHHSATVDPGHHRRGREDRERVIHLIADAGLEHRQHLWRESSLQ